MAKYHVSTTVNGDPFAAHNTGTTGAATTA